MNCQPTCSSRSTFHLCARQVDLLLDSLLCLDFEMAAQAAPEKADAPTIGAIGKWDSIKDQDVKGVADKYSGFFDRSKGEEGITERRANYTTVVNSYYDLVTDFYE